MLTILLGQDVVIGLYERLYFEIVTAISRKVDTAYAGFDSNNPAHNPKARKWQQELSKEITDKFEYEGAVLKFNEDTAFLGKMNGEEDRKGNLEQDLMIAEKTRSDDGITITTIILTMSGYHEKECKDAVFDLKLLLAAGVSGIERN